MLPDNRVSTTVVSGRFLPPDDQRTLRLVDQEMGGVGLNDPSAGLQYQMWTLSYVGGSDVTVTPQSGASTVLFSLTGITELALAFDQNMCATVTYRREGVLYLRWWDSTVSGYVTSDFGAGYSPRLTLDDKRDSQRANSDIIFAYIQGNALKYRQQRDRFLTERVLRSDLDGSTRLRTIGMNRNYRLQFELV
jgi:hypothetical protein